MAEEQVEVETIETPAVEQEETVAGEDETLNEPLSNDEEAQEQLGEEQQDTQNEQLGEDGEPVDEDTDKSTDLIEAEDEEKPEEKVVLDPHEAEYQEQLARNRERNQQQLTEKNEDNRSYYTNTEKEQRVLDYVDNFDRQYQLLFPHRKALVMNMKNEFDSVKVLLISLYTLEICLHDYPTNSASLQGALRLHRLFTLCR
jgi:hypothetical protein